MGLTLLGRDFSVCKLGGVENIDLSHEYVFLQKTDEEISLVCETRHTPENAVAAEAGWKALRVTGILDFSLIGVIAKITAVLAGAGISVFAMSTYNTDYILIKAENVERGIKALVANGYIMNN